MGGSPMIQNGKVVGAVMHALVNDPTREMAFLSKMCRMRRIKRQGNSKCGIALLFVDLGIIRSV